MNKKNKSIKKYGHGYKQKVFITGISGFVGSNLAKELAGDYSVSGMLRWSPRVAKNAEPLKGKVQLIEGDLRDHSRLSWILRTIRPDYVVHLAAITPVSYSFDHPQEVNEVNYLGTVNLVEACRREVPNLKKFVFASTMEIYGRQEAKPFDENTLPHPNSPYAVAKYAAERYLAYLYHTYKYPTVAVRGSNVFGRKQDTYFVTEAAITKMLKNSNEISMGNNRPVRSFIYIKDKVNLYRTILESDNPEIFGEVFNSGPCNGLSIKHWVEKIADVMNWNGKINWNTREARAGEIYYLNTKNDKAKEMLEWEPEYTLDEGLKEHIEYWEKKMR